MVREAQCFPDRVGQALQRGAVARGVSKVAAATAEDQASHISVSIPQAHFDLDVTVELPS